MWCPHSLLHPFHLSTWLLRNCRCLGDPQFKENDKDVVECTPEMRRVELQPGDFAIVLASDGLWDVLSDTEVVTILQKVRAGVPSTCPVHWTPQGAHCHTALFQGTKLSEYVRD